MKRSFLALGVFGSLAVLVGCPEGREGAARREARIVEIWRENGLQALYTQNVPEVAVAELRKVVARNPSDGDATFHLAVALDRARKSDEARPYWERALTLATSGQDAGRVAVARVRLGLQPATIAAGEATTVARTSSAASVSAPAAALASPEALMKTGMDLVYRKQDPVSALPLFRKVLEANPAHYGATYQLAYALDQAGKRAEARPLWEKVVVMAQAYNDPQTGQTARKRLETRP